LKKQKSSISAGEQQSKSFLDMIAPGVIKFFPDHFICGNTYRCVWALREYPTATDEQAILRHLGEMDGVTLHIYTRQVTAVEEDKLLTNATNKNRMVSSGTNNLKDTINAENNLHDVATLISTMRQNREPLLHCAVFIELMAQCFERLKLLQTAVQTELMRSKLNVDRLLLRQQQGFACSMASGANGFGSQFERVLPASSVAQSVLSVSTIPGKTDPHDSTLAGGQIRQQISFVDFNRRDEDKTNGQYPQYSATAVRARV